MASFCFNTIHKFRSNWNQWPCDYEISVRVEDFRPVFDCQEMEGTIGFGACGRPCLKASLNISRGQLKVISKTQLHCWGFLAYRLAGLSRFAAFGRWDTVPCINKTKKPMILCNSQKPDGTEDPAVFAPQSNIPEPPPEWKGWEERWRQRELNSKEGITIRRRPPTGPPLHYVGPFEFRLQNEGNTPRNILEEIVWNKDKEVAEMKDRMPISSLKKALSDAPPVRDFISALKSRAAETGMPALIAEVKKASPSRGVIQPNFDPVQIAQAYEKGGAACLSVLTDCKYFQGSFENLQAIRNAGIQCPLLCKEFIIDAWQLYYARSKGADAVLLIAAILPDHDIKYMRKICKLLGMATLVEVHNAREMDRVLGIDGMDLIGINNRDLETFEVDINTTGQLLQGDWGKTIHNKDIIVIGESGLFTPDDIAFVQKQGVKAVLVGESIVKQSDPAAGIAGLFGIDISRKYEMQTTAA